MKPTFTIQLYEPEVHGLWMGILIDSLDKQLAKAQARNVVTVCAMLLEVGILGEREEAE